MAQHRSLNELLETASFYASLKPPPPLHITEHETAKVTGHSVPSLRKRRLQGKEPRFYKVGAFVRYDYFEVIDWLRSCARTSTTQAWEK